ncbi:MAG TPA: EAL domain-containing protein [Polyangiaceae bacterium]|nr:EAL domain-containing protein [Polyangiaceae bacterium]
MVTVPAGLAAPIPRVLVVDDEPAIRRVLSDFLKIEGFAVDTAPDGEVALSLLTRAQYDVVISDLKMPKVGGLELLGEIARLNPEALTIVMTGFGTVDTAIHAMKAGAYDYILKPFKVDVVLATIVQGLARRRKEALEQSYPPFGGPSRATRALKSSFRRAVDSLWLAFQPILTSDGHEVYGHEVLLRSDEPNLTDPVQVLEAAELLGSLDELGRVIRERAVEAFEQLPSEGLMFVNLHPKDLADPALFLASEPLSRIAQRVVLEITERSSLDKLDNVGERVAKLRRMGFRIAVDDLGAGYAGLTTFAQLEPEIVKLDMSLVRDVNTNPTKRKVVRSMTQLAREIGALVVAEGVESEEELEAVVHLGCDFVQGFYFARPERVSPSSRPARI